MSRGRVPGSVDPGVWFHPFVDRSGGEDACWPWTRTKTPKGYGHVWDRREKRYVGAHCVALSINLGVLPRDLLQALHHCDNPICCNPRHLFNGTQAQNQQDMVRKGRGAMQKKTHCKRDHPLSGSNIRINVRGERVCLTCDRANQRAARLRRKFEAKKDL